jgi:hypothetical protein
MSARRRGESADIAYLRPIVARLGAAEVHRLVDLIAMEAEGNGKNGEPSPTK